MNDISKLVEVHNCGLGEATMEKRMTKNLKTKNYLTDNINGEQTQEVVIHKYEDMISSCKRQA